MISIQFIETYKAIRDNHENRSAIFHQYTLIMVYDKSLSDHRACFGTPKEENFQGLRSWKSQFIQPKHMLVMFRIAWWSFDWERAIVFNFRLVLDVAAQYCYWWAASWQKQQNNICVQWRFRSAWASAQSDQSLRCPHEETLGPQVPTERTAKTLIRLGGCPGWSESSLGA